MDDLIKKYGSVEAARQRRASLSVLGRALTDDEVGEMALIDAVLVNVSAMDGAPVGTPAPRASGGAASGGAGSSVGLGSNVSAGASDKGDGVGGSDERDVEEWARVKKTPRDLLCVAATASDWQLQPEYFEPARVSEAAYDAAVERARGVLAAARLKAPGRNAVVVLTLPDQLVGVVARRLTDREARKCIDEVGDDNKAISDNALPQMMLRATLWPTDAALADLRDLVPLAFSDIWPQRLLEMSGLSRAKKKR